MNRTTTTFRRGSDAQLNKQPAAAAGIWVLLCFVAVLGVSLAGAVAQTNPAIGRIAVWGSNTSGQTNVPAGLSNVIAVAAGANHVLAVKSNGTVVAWGDNASGQTNVPPGLSDVVAVAGGYQHSMALKSNGKVIAWGANNYGQTNVPASLSGVVAIAAGQYHSVALKTNGTVVSWGWNLYSQTNTANWTGIKAIAAGNIHSLGLQSGGGILSQGDGSYGKGSVPVLEWRNITAIAGGGEHSLGIQSDRTVVAAGAGGLGDTGHPHYGQSTVPDDLGNVIAIAGGMFHSLALQSNRTVVAWGAGGPGQTGYPHYAQSTVPEGLGDVIAIAAGGFFSLALVATEPPTIQTPPASQTVALGDTVDFSVMAAGSSPRSYQWLFNATNCIADATNAALQLPDVQLSQAGAYSVVVTNAFGAVTSSPALLNVLAAPVIVNAPTNQMAVIGATVEFSVATLGSPPLAYQWFFNGTNALPGATNATLQLVDAQPSQAGAYSVVVTNAYGAVTSAPAALAFYPPGTVLVDTADALRAAMQAGGTIAFTEGTITLDGPLTNTTDTVLDGTGRSVRLSGGWHELFYVSTNTSLTLVNLTISDGMGRGPIGPPEPRGSGGAVIIDGGTLNVHHTTFTANQAASGGAVLNQGGTLNLFDSRFATNQAANGGAILNQGGVINAVNCVFAGNLGQQPQPHITASIEGHGGAILNGSGSVVLQDCLFTANRAQGTTPLELLVWAAAAFGGAIENQGTLTVTRCTFSQNVASGANGFDNRYTAGGSSTSGASGTGGAIYSPGPLAVDSSAFLSNTVTGGDGPPGGNGVRGGFSGSPGPGGNGGSGGSAYGGAICVNGTAYAVNSTFACNTALGGAGGNGGGGGANDLHGLSGANGGPGGAGGSAFGGLYGGIRLTNCTLAFNAATARSGGLGGPGGAGIPPGVNGVPGPDGSDGVAGGAMTEGVCVNTLLASNTPGGNCLAGVSDGGHNLSSDVSCVFTNVGSLNNTDPRLALLANNGGPTLTIALLPGSPAIDAADPASAPPTDQRGFLRPVGPAADIGAFEYGAPAFLQISQSTGNEMNVVVFGVSGQSCRLLASSNMSNWIPIATNQIGPNGTVLFHDNCDPGAACRFYRLALP